MADEKMNKFMIFYDESLDIIPKERHSTKDQRVARNKELRALFEKISSQKTHSN